MNDNNYAILSNSLTDLLDKRVGIINDIWEEKPLIGSPPFFHYCSHTSNTNAFCPQKNFRTSRGIAISRERALAKAIGEGIERYCSAVYNKDDLPFCSYEEARFDCINPDEFLKYHPDQYNNPDFSFYEFSQSRKARWASVTDVTNKNKTCYIPASYVYLPYAYGKQEEKIGQNISTGLACHTTYDSSAITAICEVVERDAFMIFWRNGLSPSKIIQNSLPSYIQKIIGAYTASNQKVFLFDITTDIKIPTILAAIRCTIPGNPALIIAASCKLTPEAAILAALEELELTRSYCLNLISQQGENSCQSKREVKKQEDHLLFWSKQSNLDLANFLFESTKQIDMNELPHFQNTSGNELTSIIELFKKLDLRILLKDITTPDLIDYSIHVIRAIIPKLHPLAFGYKNDEFISTRLQSVPQKLGLSAQNKIVYIPHPFP